MIFMKLYLAQSVSEEPGILEDKLKTVLTENVGTGTIFDVNSDDEKKESGLDTRKMMKTSYFILPNLIVLVLLIFKATILMKMTVLTIDIL